MILDPDSNCRVVSGYGVITNEHTVVLRIRTEDSSKTTIVSNYVVTYYRPGLVDVDAAIHRTAGIAAYGVVGNGNWIGIYAFNHDSAKHRVTSYFIVRDSRGRIGEPVTGAIYCSTKVVGNGIAVDSNRSGSAADSATVTKKGGDIIVGAAVYGVVLDDSCRVYAPDSTAFSGRVVLYCVVGDDGRRVVTIDSSTSTQCVSRVVDDSVINDPG